MKFVLAPDKFKGSLTGKAFCVAVERGLQKVFPQATLLKKPLADGGDGTLEVVQDYLEASVIKIQVTSPIFEPISASYLYSTEKKTAFIEMSEASGYRLLENRSWNCLHTTTLGTGELLLDALDRGAEHILLGIGGSATNDGGMGVAEALGFRFLDETGEALSPTGENLEKVKHISNAAVDPRLAKADIKVACDVDNPLYGPKGAAFVYGPQKQANPAEVKKLDKGLRLFALKVKEALGVDMQNIPGAGAAGGLGGGAVAFLGASLASGIDLIKEIADFDTAIQGADWIVTGEGKLDDQTLSGKTIAGVLKSAKKQNIPVAALCGLVTLTPAELKTSGISYAKGVSEGISDMTVAYRDAALNLERAAEAFAKSLIKG